MRGLAVLVLAASVVAPAQPLLEVFDKAVAALSRGDYASAESGFQEILKTAPNHVDSLLNLGVVYSRTGRIDQAIAVYQRALAVKPHHHSVLLNLGLAYMRKQSYAEALPVFQRLVAEDPASLPTHDIHLLFPLCDGFRKQERTEEDRRRLEAFLAALPPAAASLVRCKFQYISGLLEEAARQCRQAVELDPHFAGAHLELARVLVDQHDSEAPGVLTAAIRENPTDPEALYDLGVVLSKEGRLAEAERYFERSRSVNPGFWGAYFQLGKLRLQSNQPVQAAALLQKAVELNPASFSLFYELARALAAAGRTEEAARAIQKVRELMAVDLAVDSNALRKK